MKSSQLVVPLIFMFIAVNSPSSYAIDQNICESGKTIVLHNNGALAACDLRDVYSTNGIQCSNVRATFYDNGMLESCQLSIPVNIDGTSCDQTGTAVFYPDGKLKSCKTTGQ